MEFETTCRPDCVEIALIERGIMRRRRELVRDDWASVPEPLSAVVKKLRALADSEQATWNGSRLSILNAVAADFQSTLAAILKLPPIAPLILDISFRGHIGDPAGCIDVDWKDTQYRPVSPRREGLAVSWGGETWRLAGPLFRLIEAIDAFNRNPGTDIPVRVACWDEVKKALAQVDPNAAGADEYTKNLTVFQAGSFALDVSEGRGGIDFKPVLMSRAVARSLEDNAPTEDQDDGAAGNQNPFEELIDEKTGTLLVSEDQRAFLRRFDQSDHETSLAYTLRRNTYLLLDPELRRALDVVKRMRSASDEQKREFVKNPRPTIARELGIEGGGALVTALFVETKQYSDRVIGLGLWEKPVLPWLRKVSVEWLPEKFPARVSVNGRQVEVSRQEANALKDAVDAAELTDHAEIVFQSTPIGIDTARDILKQIDASVGSTDQPPVGPVDEPDRAAEEPTQTATPQGEPGQFVVKIKTNYEGVDYEILRRPRHGRISIEVPSARMGRSVFKRHQHEGFRWLVEAWLAGWPGVLLADDMGLGKTFQALAFLAWCMENRQGAPSRGQRADAGPILIVAPTALLDNWIEEAEKHLAPDALGDIAKVFGSGLRQFKNDQSESGSEEPLDTGKLKECDWILTTYETLADNHTSFAKIAYSIAIFDEMQKIKDPGTLNTLASKAMNVDFVVGLTGTPVENRIEDLWSIIDRVFPGYLGDLKTFSKSYENADQEKYRSLSDRLSQKIDGAPALMLRRLKEEVLEGLPKKVERKYRTTMPSPQAEAYQRVVTNALSGNAAGRGRGEMLKVIQDLRSISLYPDDPWRYDLSSKHGCEAWIERSARLGKTIEILRDVDRRGEKALVFVEHRYMQERLAEAVTTMFDLDEPPFVINGAMPGTRRQKLVNQFQTKRNRFDLMILSPKAAGVGLTITAANHVVHLSRWWNPAVEDQCNDRAYRIGQTKDVTIHIPITVHPEWGDKTFDVTLDQLLGRKRTLSRKLLAPPVSEEDLSSVYEATFDVKVAV